MPLSTSPSVRACRRSRGIPARSAATGRGSSCSVSGSNQGGPDTLRLSLGAIPYSASALGRESFSSSLTG
eukprot:4390487-Alexandrium_andersonii.AAC.1